MSEATKCHACGRPLTGYVDPPYEVVRPFCQNCERLPEGERLLKRYTKPAIFVFGSNREGRHGAGAAKCAMMEYGAIYGQAEGLQGHSYAIVTKELRRDHPPVTLDEIKTGVDRFKEFADGHRGMIFRVTPIGCGLAGFTPKQIAPLFDGCPHNVELPDCFIVAILET